MSSIEMNVGRMGGAPVVNDPTLYTTPGAQTAAAESSAVLSGANVTVDGSLDSLLERLGLKIQRAQDSSNLAQLKNVTAVLASQANASAAEIQEIEDMMAEYDQLLVDAEKAQQTADAEQAKLDEMTRNGAPADDIAAQQQVVNAANQSVTDINTNIQTKKTEISSALSKLDPKSINVLASAIRITAGDLNQTTEIMETLRDEATEIPALEKFLELLAGENAADVILEQVGIKA